MLIKTQEFDCNKTDIQNFVAGADMTVLAVTTDPSNPFSGNLTLHYLDHDNDHQFEYCFDICKEDLLNPICDVKNNGHFLGVWHVNIGYGHFRLHYAWLRKVKHVQ